MDLDFPSSTGTRTSARVPFKTVLASILGLWLSYFVLTTLRAELLDLPFAGEMTWRRGLASAAGVVTTIGLWLVLRLFDARPFWTKLVAALVLSLPVAVTIAHTNRLAMADLEIRVQQVLDAREGGEPKTRVTRQNSGDILISSSGADAEEMSHKSAWEDITDVAFGRYFMMLAWCAFYLSLLTGERARAAERREGDYRRAAKAAELRSLRYQVNPHFLFNTLNSLSALVLTGKTEAAERMIQTISTFYRRSLANDPTADVPLHEEFALQKLYLDIEGVRFPQRLRAEYDLPPDLAEARVPGMILQPLVENSVKHAVAPTAGQVTITLAAREEYGRLLITVSDRGGRRAAGGVQQPGHGIGLANVRERLEARFGREATISSGLGPEGYSTQLRIPLLRQEEDTV
jgi:hypothetical protein